MHLSLVLHCIEVLSPTHNPNDTLDKISTIPFLVQLGQEYRGCCSNAGAETLTVQAGLCMLHCRSRWGSRLNLVCIWIDPCFPRVGMIC